MLFFSCEIGQRFTNAFDEIDDATIQLDWYLLPMNVKCALPIIMLATQKGMMIECFGSTVCNRETLKRVSIALENILKKFEQSSIQFSGFSQSILSFYGSSKTLQMNESLLHCTHCLN